jgi:hypothetical protein
MPQSFLLETLFSIVTSGTGTPEFRKDWPTGLKRNKIIAVNTTNGIIAKAINFLPEICLYIDLSSFSII